MDGNRFQSDGRNFIWRGRLEHALARGERGAPGTPTEVNTNATRNGVPNGFRGRVDMEASEEVRAPLDHSARFFASIPDGDQPGLGGRMHTEFHDQLENRARRQQQHQQHQQDGDFLEGLEDLFRIDRPARIERRRLGTTPVRHGIVGQSGVIREITHYPDRGEHSTNDAATSNGRIRFSAGTTFEHRAQLAQRPVRDTRIAIDRFEGRIPELGDLQQQARQQVDFLERQVRALEDALRTDTFRPPRLGAARMTPPPRFGETQFPRVHNNPHGGGHNDDEYAAPEPQRRLPRDKRRDGAGEANACPACGSEVAPHEVVYLSCGHSWCSDCLNNNIRASLSSRKHYPPRCCGSTPKGIDLSVIQGHLEEDVLLRLVEVGEEYASKDPTFCSNPRCGKFISIPAVQNQQPSQWATCQRCSKVTCIECKGGKDLHPSPNQHPDPMSKEDRELSEKQGWKQCPNKRCRKMIEKTEGCDHMICECGMHFCYRCGKQLDQANTGCTCREQGGWGLGHFLQPPQRDAIRDMLAANPYRGFMPGGDP